MRAKQSTSNKYILGKSHVLTGFFVLSLVTHSLFLFVNTSSESNSHNGQAHLLIGNQKLSVTLSSTASAVIVKDYKQHKIIASKGISSEPVHIPTGQPVKDAETIEDMASENKQTSTQKIAFDSAAKNSQKNYLLGEIQNRLSKYLSYPARAQRRGWQGEVMVGFHVDKQGFLNNIHITRSSGYSLLDNATLNAIGKVKSIPLNLWFKNNLDTEFHPAALQLPVIYQLTNS